MNDPLYCTALSRVRACGTRRDPRSCFGLQGASLPRGEMMMKDLVGVDGKMWINGAQIELIAMTSHNGGAA